MKKHQQTQQQTTVATVAGINTRAMPRLWQYIAREGVTDTCMFEVQGRDIVDVRYDTKTGLETMRVYPIGQFNPFACIEYDCIRALDKVVTQTDDRGNEYKIEIWRATLQNPFDEKVSTKEWLDNDQYLDRLIRSEVPFRSRGGTPAIRVRGRLAFQSRHSYPATCDAENRILLIEGVRGNEFVVIPQVESDGTKVEVSSGTKLALGNRHGVVSSAVEGMFVKKMRVKIKAGQNITQANSDDALDFFENRMHILDALADRTIMGDMAIARDAGGPAIKRAVQKLLASIHPDRTPSHPFFTQMAVLGVRVVNGKVEGGPYAFRRNAEYMLVFLRDLAEKAGAYADELLKPADLSGIPKDREPSASRRGGNGRNGNKGQAPASEAETVEAPVAVITTGKPEESDDWGTADTQPAPATEAQASADDALLTRDEVTTAIEEAEVAVEAAPATEDVPVAQAAEATEVASTGSTTDIEAKIAAINVRLETEEDMLPNTKKFLTKELTRLRGQLKAATTPKAPKAAKPPKVEKPVLKGLANLGALVAGNGNEE